MASDIPRLSRVPLLETIELRWLVVAQIAFSCVLVALVPWSLALSWLGIAVGGTLLLALQARRTRWRVRTRAHERARQRRLDWGWLACVALACSLVPSAFDVAIQAWLVTALALLSIWIGSRPTEDAVGVGVALCILWIPQSAMFLLHGFAQSPALWAPAVALVVSAASVMVVCVSHAREFALQAKLRERAQSHALSLVAERATAWRLVSAICHDLRQPGHALSLYADHLVRRATPPADPLAAMAADGLMAAQRSLDRMLSQAIELVKLESQAARPHLQPVSISKLFDELCAQFALLGQERGIKLVALARAGGAAGVRADELMLWRVMSNLIDNAIAHSARGSSVALVARRSTRGVSLQVRDAGPGIPLHEQAQIFDDYVRAAPDARVRRQGFGLGLAIAKRMVVVMNGTISVRSAPGSGCCMTVTLPAASISTPTNLGGSSAGSRSAEKARKT